MEKQKENDQTTFTGPTEAAREDATSGKIWVGNHTVFDHERRRILISGGGEP